MIDKKKRYGIKKVGEDISKLFFMQDNASAQHYGVVGSRFHYTWIDEGDFISIHKKDQETGDHIPLGKYRNIVLIKK